MKSKVQLCKAAQNKANLKAMYDLYRQIKEDKGICSDNEWNVDKSGYCVGIIELGVTIQTYCKINVIELLNPNNYILVTIIEAILVAS